MAYLLYAVSERIIRWVAPIPYGQVIARNIRAARSRADLTQGELADRMRALGFTAWLRQTVPSVEKGRRRVTAEEIHGLAWSLGTTIAALMSPSDEDREVELPGGQILRVRSVQATARGFNDMAVMWPGPGEAQVPMITRGGVVRDASGHVLSNEELLAGALQEQIAASRQAEGETR